MPLPFLFDLNSYELDRVVQQAEMALTHEVRSIVTEINPRSAGGPHDFSSEGDYWWPDPDNPDGPYIQRDGMSNPDNFVAHRELLLDFASDVGALAAAFEITGDEQYAQAATRHLHTWFVDPETRMNPDLQYSQAIKGRFTGRGIGIIDTLHLAEVALAIEALRESTALESDEDAALTDWFRQYLRWMRTHPYGIDESETTNNHAVSWALQCATFARLTGDAEVIADCRRRLTEVFLPMQMAPNQAHPEAPLGSFPRETARTKPYGYSIFNLDTMTALAVALSTPDDNLLAYELPDGRSILKGVEFLAPFIADKSSWPFRQDVQYWNDWPVRQPFLLFGALANGREDWLELWKTLDPEPTLYEVRRNFPIRQPVLWLR